ncbi:kinesin motor domain-containing protein [Apiospora phragmitis]|uniref:Kinesin motor domain-containing protein n=1 Tax=Apiospora phragmitis TaxID=2905665 RepID=A0ABR1X756_9PEZI
MDQFYLDNAALYESLVERAKPAPLARRPGQTADLAEANMIVAARIRPQLEEDLASGFPCAVYPRSDAGDVDDDDSGVVDIHDLGKPVLKSAKYEVDRLFGPEKTTEEIFDVHVKHLVPFAWNGGIGTLFAYGQTGSGKTFTVSRLEELVVDALVDLDPDSERQVSITIIELAGNAAFDLLNRRQPVSIMEDAKGVQQLVGAQECTVQEHADVQDLIERATAFRRSAPTLKNDDSSRSHSICRIRIQKHDGGGGKDGFLYLVDLAGSEGARDVAVHGADRMRETREINISLSVLKDCIRGRALADAMAEKAASRQQQGTGAIKKKQPPHIPFRQSALTKVLKHVFDPAGGRACKTAVIASWRTSGLSKNTLRYAEILRVTPPSSAAVATTAPASSTVAPASNTAASGVSTSSAKAVPNKSSPRVSAKPNSRDPDPDAASVPFRHRLRPGMVIRLKPSSSALLDGDDDVDTGSGSGSSGAPQLAVLLCPEMTSDVDSPDKARRARKAMQYVCASLVPAAGEACCYEMNLWEQFVVDSGMIDREVILEYNPETWYYYVYHIV